MSVAPSSDHSGSITLSRDLRARREILCRHVYVSTMMLCILNQIQVPGYDRYLLSVLVIIELDH